LCRFEADLLSQKKRLRLDRASKRFQPRINADGADRLDSRKTIARRIRESRVSRPDRSFAPDCPICVAEGGMDQTPDSGGDAFPSGPQVAFSDDGCLANTRGALRFHPGLYLTSPSATLVIGFKKAQKRDR